jgi:hypothetical protein
MRMTVSQLIGCEIMSQLMTCISRSLFLLNHLGDSGHDEKTEPYHEQHGNPVCGRPRQNRWFGHIGEAPSNMMCLLVGRVHYVAVDIPGKNRIKSKDSDGYRPKNKFWTTVAFEPALCGLGTWRTLRNGI